MKKMNKKQQEEERICTAFIQAAEKELGSGHIFSFLRCEEEGRDPPDCWVKYKEMNVGVELMALHREISKRDISFCQAIVDILNNKQVAPIGISPQLEVTTCSLRTKESANAIASFVSNHANLLSDCQAMNMQFSLENPDISSRVFLQPLREGDRQVRCCPILMNSIEELMASFVEKVSKKIDDAKNVDSDRVILLLHFNDIFNGGTFLQVDLEICFACFIQNIRKIDPDKIFYRYYIFSEQGFYLYGRRVKVARLL